MSTLQASTPCHMQIRELFNKASCCKSHSREVVVFMTQ